MKIVKVIKSKDYFIKKRASELNWSNVSYGQDYYGYKYFVNPVNKTTINLKSGSTVDADYTPEEIVESLDLYDKNGNLLSNHKELK